MGKFTMKEHQSKFDIEEGANTIPDDKVKFCCCRMSRQCYLGIVLGLLITLGVPTILILGAMINAAVCSSPYKQMELTGIGDQFMSLEDTDRNRLANNLREALGYATVSSEIPEDNLFENIAAFNEFVTANFPTVHSHPNVHFELVNTYSRFYRVEGSTPTANPYLLMGHIDVVPPGDSTWQCDPFQGTDLSNCTAFGEETIFGRGAIDDKHSVMGILEALEYKLSIGEIPTRTFYLCFGHDEEISGYNGAGKLSEKLEDSLNDNGESLDFILDEGMFVMQDVIPGVDRPVAYFGVVEKGWAMFDITTHGEQVHSSTPPKKTAIGDLGEAVHKLERNVMPSRLGEGAEIATLNYVAAYADFTFKLAMANVWLFAPLIKAGFATDYYTDAVQRTTTAVTIIDGGFKENVVPDTAHAVINHRLHQADTIETCLEHDNKVVDDPTINIVARGDFFLPTPESPFNNEDLAWQILTNSALEVFPTSIPTPGTMVANTDTKFYIHLTNKVYRFSPVLLDVSGLGLFHGIDERIGKDEYIEVIQFYYRLMVNADFDTQELVRAPGWKRNKVLPLPVPAMDPTPEEEEEQIMEEVEEEELESNETLPVYAAVPELEKEEPIEESENETEIITDAEPIVEADDVIEVADAIPVPDLETVTDAEIVEEEMEAIIVPEVEEATEATIVSVESVTEDAAAPAPVVEPEIITEPEVITEPEKVVEETSEAPVVIEEAPVVIEEAPVSVEEVTLVVEEAPVVVEEAPDVVEAVPVDELPVEETPVVETPVEESPDVEIPAESLETEL